MVGYTSSKMRNHRLQRLLIFSAAVSACAGLLITHWMTGYAQSGRRLPKAPATAPGPEAKAEAKPTENKGADDKARFAIVLGIDRGNTYYNIPLYFYDTVLQACADRLRAAPSVKLHVSGSDLNRAEAIRLAKSQKEAHVAFLELRGDSMGAGSIPSNSYSEIQIEYFVYAPESAKIATTGRTYQRAFRKGPVVVGPRTGGTTPVYVEQMLREAARDAADRILSALHLVIPGKTIPPIANDLRPQPRHKSG